MLCIYPPGIQDLNILNAYTSSMGFLDKLKRSISGGKEKADDAKDAAARAQKTVDDSEQQMIQQKGPKEQQIKLITQQMM